MFIFLVPTHFLLIRGRLHCVSVKIASRSTYQDLIKRYSSPPTDISDIEGVIGFIVPKLRSFWTSCIFNC